MLDDDRKLAIYRIAQEHLSNVVKHAGASKVRVQLDSSGGEVILEIVDDGKGFDTTAPRTGIGLSNIANRCEVFGGVAQINADDFAIRRVAGRHQVRVVAAQVSAV